MSAPRVLVVDDERFFREAIRDVVAELGVECELVASGEEALKAAEDPRVGVVVLDVRLPGIGGVQVLERLRTRRPALRVIVLSAHTDQELVLEALRLGASDYLAKPLHDEELRLAVRRALEATEVESRWQSLRGRLHLLGARLAELDALAARVEVEVRRAELASPLAEAIAEVLAASKTSVLLADASASLLNVVAATGEGREPSEMDPATVGRSVAGLAIQEGNPILIDDIEHDERCAGYVRQPRYGSVSVALAPLVGARGPFGVLCATDREGNQPFEDEDLALFRVLALHASALMAPFESAELPEAQVAAEEVEDGVAELARAVCEALTSEVEPERLIDAALRPVAEGLSASPVALYTIDGRSGELRLEGQRDAAGVSDRPRLPRDRGLTGLVLQTGRLVAADHPQSDSRFDPAVDTPADGRSRPLLCVPLKVRGKILGVARIFPAPQVGASPRAGEVLAAVLSAAVRNILLYRSLLESIEDLARARRESGGR
ncbi:MAG: response regulator [Myxococcales bacterium]|nr:response regulator [Myxococcales bacterium]MDH5307392.1 response regulator [Myxococcales bacterium]MDH5565988.1 response regulator [Myxococcales bacterium]